SPVAAWAGRFQEPCPELLVFRSHGALSAAVAAAWAQVRQHRGVCDVAYYSGDTCHSSEVDQARASCCLGSGSLAREPRCDRVRAQSPGTSYGGLDGAGNLCLLRHIIVAIPCVL